MNMRLLVANRGEIAVRILRAAAELGMATMAVFAEDDAQSLHIRRAEAAQALRGRGVSAYLDMEQLLAAAKEHGCDAVHPGYGFLSENAVFARRCHEEGLAFVGPAAETLELLGDKAKARALARRLGVPVLPGTEQPVSLDQARAFLASLGDEGAMVIKAVAGGGGRGMRTVFHADEVEEAYTRCRSEARQSLGLDQVYVEQFMPRARHIEVQILGDGAGGVSHLWERECSLQRRYQKLMEIAPCPGLAEALRAKIMADAVRLAEALSFRGLGTFEFLVDAGEKPGGVEYAFIEANPRLQVEHTVTEEVTGVDLVKAQLRVAAGAMLRDLGLTQADVPRPQGYAVQARVNLETMDRDGTVRPASGLIKSFEPPTGPGVRTDTCGYAGYAISPSYDPLLAKVIGHSRSPNFAEAVARTYRALCEFKIEGVRTNIPLLQNLLKHPDFIANRIYTRFVEDHLEDLAAEDAAHPRLFVPSPESAPRARAGAKVDAIDPLAVLDYGKSEEFIKPPNETAPDEEPPQTHDYDMTGLEHTVAVKALMQGTIVSIDVQEGDLVREGQPLLVMESMKMEHVIKAEVSGLVVRLAVSQGDTVYEGHPLVFIEERELETEEAKGMEQVDLDHIRPDLAESIRRHEILEDAARPESVALRRQRGQRTARENIADLCDPGTFVEYGGLVIAGQRLRRSVEDLIQRTPADGLVAGTGCVNRDLFGEERSRCVVLSYDYMVLAGTQGLQNHKKKDRMFELAARLRLPLVFFTEGGGGRPGDTDHSIVAALDVMAFHLFGRLSGLVPLVGVNSGRCFAGNAALLGCCDVVIAARNSNIGMGGPAMIEGGGLGVFRSEEVGPMSVQVPNGVVDIAVADEAEGVRLAKKYLSYFQGPVDQWAAADQRLLRGIIPENRLRIYDVRSVIQTLADTDSVLELRPHYGLGMVTALIRIEGRPLGVIANNPKHLSGAIDSPGADKAARFMQLCDAFDLPILLLCDTPGMMVGPEVEKTGLVRHCCRLFVTGGSLTVPFFTIVLRKAYGLGAQTMAGGSFRAPVFVVSWPTGEYGGMGLEGAVKLGYRKELAAVQDSLERKELFDKMVAASYERGKAINTASHFEIDDVIDPAESRRVIVSALKAAPRPQPRTGKKRPMVDTW